MDFSRRSFSASLTFIAAVAGDSDGRGGTERVQGNSGNKEGKSYTYISFAEEGFAIGATQNESGTFMPFFGTIAISLLMTALFNASKGSIFLAALMHFQLMNPLWPDAQPYDTYALTAIAAGIILLRRKEMFSGKKAFTTVVMNHPTHSP
ncbi:MAG: hypothetical protein GF401_05005 [Chitinivibrionales bacterium]|nr:hypothetical protein [Chitinivibrionales bacterium]